MTDHKLNLGSAPSEKVGLALGKLHPVTRLVILAGVMSLVADIVIGICRFANPMTAIEQSGFMNIATMLHDIAYTALFASSAATVEYLFRIWNEIRRHKGGKA